MNAVEPSDPGLRPGDLDTVLGRLLGRLGHTLNRWSLREVDRTGSATTLLIEAHVRTGGSGETERHVGLTTAELPAGTVAGTDILHGIRWTLWMHPHDPRLPGLARAVDPEHLRRLIGAEPLFEPLLALRMISYRPLRRAVLRADVGATAQTPARSIYLKVLPDDVAAATVLRHRLLSEANVPVAPVLAAPELGMVALGGLAGRSLASRLVHHRTREDDAQQILGVLDRLPATVLDLPTRPGWAARLSDLAPSTHPLLTDQQRRWDTVLEKIHSGLQRQDPGPLVPAHGDLYEAHLLFDGGALTGLLDVDGVGPGHRIDDAACLLAHLSVLPTVDPRYRNATTELRELRERLSASITGPAAGSDAVSPHDMALRTAAVVCTLLPPDPVLRGTPRAEAARHHARELALQRLQIIESLVEPPH